MNLIISQMISLVCRYKDYVGSGYLPKNYLESCVFDDCETVGFMLVNIDGCPTYKHGDIVAANPIRWFKLLQE